MFPHIKNSPPYPPSSPYPKQHFFFINDIYSPWSKTQNQAIDVTYVKSPGFKGHFLKDLNDSHFKCVDKGVKLTL